MTDSIFTSTETQTDFDNVGESFVEGTEEELLGTLVGDGKKFKSVEALAKGKILSDAHIQRLQEENKTLRQQTEQLNNEIGNKAKIEDLIKELRNRGTSMDSGNNLTPAENNRDDSKTVPLDTDSIVSKVLESLESRSRVSTEETNQKKVVNEAKRLWGSEWKQRLAAAGEAIGMDEEMIDIWARKNPDAIIKVLSPMPNHVPANTPGSSINTSALNTHTESGVRNKAYYTKLKAKDPSGYWSPSVQIQMHKDAQKLGEKFFE